jgi:GNAT superfamily N-acetyltransferase
MSSPEQVLSDNVVVRHYRNGDESKIVDLLNLCYGQWGEATKWQGVFCRYPTFNKDDVFILEKNGGIIAHRSSRFRNLITPDSQSIFTAQFADTAVHPQHRGSGIYTRLHELTLDAVRARGACLIFTTNLRGSTSYNHNKKTGFIELRQAPAYIKIINPQKVLRSGLSDFIHKNQKIRGSLQDLRNSLFFRIGKTEFPVGELLGETAQQPETGGDRVTIVLDESSAFLVTRFRTSGRLQRIASLVSLLLRGKIRVKSSSFRAFVKFLRKGAAVIASL